MKIPRTLTRLLRVATLAACVLLLSSRAQAATIIFDMCTVASLCDGVNFFPVQYTNHLQPPTGFIDGSFGGSFIDVLSFGINFSGASLNMSPTLASLGPGEIGPYGTFSSRFEGPPLEFFNLIFLQFVPTGQPFANDLAPFFANSQGIVFAAEVRNFRTGDQGFIAARLDDQTPVPEPGTMTLLGLGLAYAAKRRLSQQSRVRS